MASFCLAIYVIHFHPWTHNWFFHEFLKGNQFNGWTFILFILLVPLITFILCTILESLRILIFRAFESIFVRIKKNLREFPKNVLDKTEE